MYALPTNFDYTKVTSLTITQPFRGSRFADVVLCDGRKPLGRCHTAIDGTPASALPITVVHEVLKSMFGKWRFAVHNVESLLPLDDNDWHRYTIHVATVTCLAPPTVQPELPPHLAWKE